MMKIITYESIKRAYTALLAAAMIAALIALQQAQCIRAKAVEAAQAMQWSADSTWTKGGWE